MSDWELAEQFVRNRNYKPRNLNWRSYIATMLLHYKADLEEHDDSPEYTFQRWLETTYDANYRLEDFDYE